jgi:hypothetical protein
MRINYIAINSVNEDTVIVPVNATTIKINGVYKQIDSNSVQFPSIEDDYVQSVVWDGTNYNIEVIRKYTQNNSSWVNKGFIDVSSEYTNEAVTNPVIITGLTQSQATANNNAKQVVSIQSQLASLDSKVPRIVEDMITAGIYKPMQQQQTIIDTKVSLRTQLQSLLV